MILLQFELPFTKDDFRHKFIFSIPEPIQKITTHKEYLSAVYSIYPSIFKRAFEVATDEAGLVPSAKIKVIIAEMVFGYVYEQLAPQLGFSIR